MIETCWEVVVIKIKGGGGSKEKKLCGTLERVKSRVGVEEKALVSTVERVKSNGKKTCNSIEKVKSKVLFGDEKMTSLTTTTTRTTTTTLSTTSTTMKGKAGGGEEKIFVTVRVRPLSSKELTKECPNNHTVAYKHPLHDRSTYPATYYFDRVFGHDCPAQRVYKEGAKDVALSSLTGLNSTIFAYG